MNDSTNSVRTVSDLFPSRWLNADELKGKTYILTISSVTFEKVNGIQGERLAAVIWFENAKKGFIINKTQAIAIQEITGTDVIKNWAGKTIAIRPGEARNHKPTIIVMPPPKQELK